MAHEGQKVAGEYWSLQLQADTVGTSVISATVGTPGTGYATAPTVAFAAPPAGGTQATGTVTILAGAVTGITITNPGSGYLVAPAITFTGGGGTLAAATSVLGINYLTLICEKTTDIKMDRAEIDASSKCGQDKAPGLKNQSITSEFLIIQGANVGTLEASSAKLFAWYLAGSAVGNISWKLGPIVPKTGDQTFSGQCWVKSMSIKATNQDRITVALDLVLYAEDTSLSIAP